MNNRQGNKKISLILVLKALEQMSDMAHPVSQIHLVKMENDIGGVLDCDVWCDRKTVGRHIKLLIAAGYDIVSVKRKGYYLNKNEFTKAESETLINLVKNSKLDELEKMRLQKKLIAQQSNVNMKKLKQYLKK